MRKNRFIITGGCGFIGTNYILELLKKGNSEILNIDKLTYASNPHINNILESNDDYSFINLDICDQKICKLIFEFKPNYIVNFAAESHVDNSISNPNEFIQTNIFGTFNLLDSTRKLIQDGNFKDFKKFHHISTDEVFGDLELDSNLTFSESTPYNPSSPYSASKAASDHLVNAWQRTYQLPIIITNCSNNFGPFQHKEKLIPKIIYLALNKEPIPIYGDGKNVRDWIFVNDHAKALIEIIFSPYCDEKYLIGSNNPHSNFELALLICDKLDELTLSHDSHVSRKLIIFSEDRLGHDLKYHINAKKFIDKYNWNNFTNFHTSLEITIKWYINYFKNQDIKI